MVIFISDKSLQNGKSQNAWALGYLYHVDISPLKTGKIMLRYLLDSKAMDHKPASAELIKTDSDSSEEQMTKALSLLVYFALFA